MMSDPITPWPPLTHPAPGFFVRDVPAAARGLYRSQRPIVRQKSRLATGLLRLDQLQQRRARSPRCL